MFSWVIGVLMSATCLSVEPRFPVVMEIPLPSSTFEAPSDLRAEALVHDSGRRESNLSSPVVRVDGYGRSLVSVTWIGNDRSRRAPLGTYELTLASSAGRTSVCVSVARPATTKNVDRLRPPEKPTVEVIVIGRSAIQASTR